MTGEAVLLGTVAIVAGSAGLAMLGYIVTQNIKISVDVKQIKDDVQLVWDAVAVAPEGEDGDEADDDEEGGEDDDTDDEDPDELPDPESFRDPLLRRIYRDNLRKPKGR